MIIMDIKSTDIFKKVDLIIKAIYRNVKNEKQFKRYLEYQLSNYYLFCIQNKINCKIKLEDDDNFVNYNIMDIIRTDYNILFFENVELKKENITINIKNPYNQ